ncbi:MAG: hypothetical protein IPK70_07280 [Flavobacteriales bacterium]|jgi:dethiobiotin synthetase|nr:hypothetical protein [Flavobacteriales bacterium]
MTRPLVLSAGILLAASCHKPKEPISRGAYHVENRTSDVLRIDATGHHGDVDLLTDSIQSEANALIMIVTEGSGGHIMPSNFLRELMISSIDSTGASILVYSGVRDADWQRTGQSQDRTDLLLVIE